MGGSFPPGYTSAPMEWEYFGSKHLMRMLGGFFGVQQDPTTLALAPGIGYAIARAKSGSGDMPADKKEGKGKREGKVSFPCLGVTDDGSGGCSTKIRIAHRIYQLPTPAQITSDFASPFYQK